SGKASLGSGRSAYNNRSVAEHSAEQRFVDRNRLRLRKRNFQRPLSEYAGAHCKATCRQHMAGVAAEHVPTDAIDDCRNEKQPVSPLAALFEKKNPPGGPTLASGWVDRRLSNLRNVPRNAQPRLSFGRYEIRPHEPV